MSQDQYTKDFSRDSETVSSLLEQNEDLMARIAASAKRSSDLERKLKEAELSKSELIRKGEILSEQVLVFREKDKLQKTRFSSLENKVKDLLAERDFHELRYSELHQKNLDLQKKRDATNRILVNKISRLDRYHKWVQDNLYTAHRDSKARENEWERKLRSQEAEIQATEKTLHEEHSRLLGIQSELKKQIVELEHDNEKLRAIASDYNNLEERYQTLKDERTAVQNRMISVEREKEDLTERSKAEQAELREKVSHYRSESKTLKLENAAFKEELTQLAEEYKSTLRKLDRLQDQNESLQELWNDNRQRLDKTSQKEVALQKLNQELSSQLKETRKKVESLQSSIQNGNRITPAPHREKESPPDSNKFERLESMLAEIQSGYSKDLDNKVGSPSFVEGEKLISETGELEI